MSVWCLLCDRVCGIVFTSSACFHTNSCPKPMLVWKCCTAAARSRRIRHDCSERDHASYELWRYDEKRDHYKTKQSERAHMKTTVENLTTIPRSLFPSRIHSQHHARTSQRKMRTFGAQSISTPSNRTGKPLGTDENVDPNTTLNTSSLLHGLNGTRSRLVRLVWQEQASQ